MVQIASDDFVIDLLKILSSHNIIPEITYRDAKIRKEFNELRSKGEKVYDIMEKLGKKYYLGEKSIDAIVYTRSRKIKMNTEKLKIE